MELVLHWTELVLDGTELVLDGTQLVLDGTQLVLDGTQLVFDWTQLVLDGTELVFFDDWMNPFDAAVVLISTLTELLSGGGGAIGAFRSLRVIRIFKLAKGWKSLQAFLESAAKAISAAFPMVALMSIFIFLFTILGLKLFKGKDLDPDRDLYGNIYFAMLSTIQVISGENWNELMYGGYSEIGALGIFYFVILYIIGNTLLFNLFVAILIDAFVAHHDEDTKGDEGEDTSSGEEATPSESQTEGVPRMLEGRVLGLGLISSDAKPRNSMSEPIVPSLTGHKLMIFSPTNPLRTFLHKMVFTDAFEYVVTFFICLSCLNLILLTYDVEEGSNLHKYTEFCSWLTAITFMVEMCMKLVVMVAGGVVPMAGAKQSTYKSTSTPSALADEWLEMEVDLGGLSCNSDPLPPSWIYQQYVYRIVMDKKFEKLTILIICLNLLPLLMEHYQQPDSLTEFLSISSITFTTIFCVEMVVKLFGLGPAGYCRSMWNLLDALCVLTTLFLGPWVASIRMVRLTRILRLVRTSPMKKLVMALVQALPGILQTGMLLLLVLFIYSMLGILMFKDVVHGEFLNRHVNFSNFSTAMFLLFRCATGESYNGIMFELAVTEPDCDRSEGNCGSWIAIPFMFSFVVFVQMILLNIFIAVVLSSYSDIALAEGRVISMFYVQMIHDRWCEKDTLQTGVLSMEKVFEIIQEIPKPLGIAKENSLHKIEPPLTEGEMFSVNRLLLPHLKGMGLELVEGHVHHRHFLFAMVCAAFIKTADNIDEETIDFVCKRAKRHAPSHSKLLTSNMSSMKRPRLLSTSFKRNRPRTESGSVVKEMKKIGTSPSSLMVNHMVGAKMTSTQPKAGDLGRDATEIRRFEIPDDEESKEGILHHFGKQSAAQLARTKEKRDEQAMRLAEKRLDAEEENQERMARGGSAEASRF
eukprot:gene7131-8506_t